MSLSIAFGTCKPLFNSTISGARGWAASNRRMAELSPTATGIFRASGNQILVCFAVKQEAKFFFKPESEILISGMGPSNAEKALKGVLEKKRHSLVLSCGFAGALNPALTVGTVLFD